MCVSADEYLDINTPTTSMLPLPEQVVLDSLHYALVREKRLPSAVFGVARHSSSNRRSQHSKDQVGTNGHW